MNDYSTMSPQAKKARADYIRSWRQKNPDKAREYNIRHWEKVAAEKQKKMIEKGENEDERS